MQASYKTLDDLAIFGGEPAFTEKQHVGRPAVGDRDRLLERINDILDSHWFTNNGKYVCEFERRVAEMAGVRHCIATCNGTVALEFAIRALGLQGEVIIPSFTFAATAHALQWQGIRPVFCDIDPSTHDIDPVQVEQLITPRTTGIIGVHVWGRPCDVERLERIAREQRLGLLFDAAHAFACSHKGRMIGSFGDAEVFSFHATKFVNTFEGGAVVTNDSEVAKNVRLMRNFGFAGLDNVICLGTNGKMNEVCAAMGLTTLDSLDELVAANRCDYERYRHELGNIPGVELVTYDEMERSNYQYVAMTVDTDGMDISRDDLISILHAENVLARRYFYPGCHRMEPYRSYPSGTVRALPHTEAVAERVLVLPTGVCVESDAIASISRIVRLVIAEHREVSRRLKRIHGNAMGASKTDRGNLAGGGYSRKRL